MQNGTYNYFINASDGVNNISTSLLSGPTVDYVNDFSPYLTSGGVIPNSTYESQIFTFRVNYSDLDNNEPAYVNVTFNGTPYKMQKQDVLDSYYIDGVFYEYKTTLIMCAG